MTTRRQQSQALIVLSTILLAVAPGSVIIPHALDLPLRPAETGRMVTEDGEALHFTYYEGSIDGGVMLLPGFGSDQVTMRSLARELVGTAAQPSAVARAAAQGRPALRLVETGQQHGAAQVSWREIAKRPISGSVFWLSGFSDLSDAGSSQQFLHP